MTTANVIWKKTFAELWFCDYPIIFQFYDVSEERYNRTLGSTVQVNTEAPSTRIRIFLNPQLFLSGYENIRVHTLCDHSVFISNSPVHTYPDSLRIHWELTKLSHQALVRPGLTQYRRGRHCFPTRLSCFCRPFCPVDNVKSLQMSSRLLA